LPVAKFPSVNPHFDVIISGSSGAYSQNLALLRCFANAQTHIIAVTASTLNSELEAGAAAGIDATLAKALAMNPLERTLHECLRKHLSRARTRLRERSLASWRTLSKANRPARYTQTLV
jgi:hypothetical protein